MLLKEDDGRGFVVGIVYGRAAAEVLLSTFEGAECSCAIFAVEVDAGPPRGECVYILL